MADGWIPTFWPYQRLADGHAWIAEGAAKAGRDPSEIERTVAVSGDDVEDIGRYVDAGATHVIVMTGTADGAPFNLDPLARLIDQRDA